MNAIREPASIGEAVQMVGQLLRERSAAATMWKLGLGLTVLSLGYIMYMMFTVGHAAFNTSSDGVNWGIAISTYAFFALTSSGLTFIASIALVFGVKALYPIAKRCIWLSIISLVAGFAVLSLELGHPFRLLWAVPAGMQVGSPMFWMGMLYGLDLVLLLGKFEMMRRGDWDSPLSQWLGKLGFIVAILASGMLGSIFGSMAMRPMWFGGFAPVYFLLTAALCGAALFLFGAHMAYGFDRDGMPERLRATLSGDGLSKIFAGLIGVGIVMVVARLFVGGWGNLDGTEGFLTLARSWQYNLIFWGGLVLPLLIMTRSTRQTASAQIAASLLVLVAMFADRYVFIVSGQAEPMFKGTWASSLVPYAPSLTEWALPLLGVALVLALLAVGEKLFDLSASPGAAATEATA